MSDADVLAAEFTGYDVVRILLGLVLLTAAGLKGHQLATEPAVGTGLLDSRWFLIGVVEFELLFGLTLLAGIFPKSTWIAALACFACFAGVSAVKAVLGDASCGCFGRVPVNPWHTFGLDLTAIVALLRWQPPDAKPQYGTQGFASLRFCLVRVGTLFLVGKVVFVAVSASFPFNGEISHEQSRHAASLRDLLTRHCTGGRVDYCHAYGHA